MRLDKWTWVIGGLAVAAAVVLGALAGARAGVLAALAGLVPTVLWQTAANRRSTLAARTAILDEARVTLAPPESPEAEGVPGGVARYLRLEEAVVEFWPRPELGALRDWLEMGSTASEAVSTPKGEFTAPAVGKPYNSWDSWGEGSCNGLTWFNLNQAVRHFK